MHQNNPADAPNDVIRQLSDELEIGHMNGESEFHSSGDVSLRLNLWPDDERGARIGARAALILQDAGYTLDSVEVAGSGDAAWIQASATTKEE